MAWQGGPLGLDRPLERAFVIVERRVGRRWRRAASDLGLSILWTVDQNGRHTASWDVPRTAPTGTYRMVVEAKRYRLVSRSFTVQAARSLVLRELPAAPGRVAVALDYPAAVRDVDLNHRPPSAGGGTVRFRVGGRTVTVRKRRGTSFSVAAPAGTPVSVPAGAAADRHGNVAAGGIALQP